MQIKDFAVEQWMNEWETKCTYNVAETCVYSLTLDQLFDAACAVEQTEFAVDVKMYECHEAAFLSRKSAAVTPGLLRSSPCPLPPEPAACACGG